MKRSEFLKWLAVVAAVYAAAHVLSAVGGEYMAHPELPERGQLGLKLVGYAALAPLVGAALLILWLGSRYFAGRAKRQLPAEAITWSGPEDSVHRRIALTSLLIALGSQIGFVVYWILSAFVDHRWPSDVHGWLRIDLAHVLDRIIGADNIIVSFIEWLAASYLLYFLVFAVLRTAAGIRSLRESFARPVLVSTRTALPADELKGRETTTPNTKVGLPFLFGIVLRPFVFYVFGRSFYEIAEIFP